MKKVTRKNGPGHRAGGAAMADTAEGGHHVGEGGELHQTAGGEHPPLTTNQGVPVSDNQNSLRAHARGPTLLEDFVLREKITHFDHERIPERIVHARGTAAHGYFELTESLAKYTTAKVLTEVGVKTPRLHAVLDRRRAAPARSTRRATFADSRSSSTRKEGNWDLVGNNIPVFFIQDAIKFPDLIHAVKMEPDRGFPQSATAHDTFWDFISLTPESMHMVMWIMSDRTLPRSLRMIEGFGIHTFRLVDAEGDSTFVKFHWRPKLGLQSTIWDEAVKIAGRRPGLPSARPVRSHHGGPFPGVGARGSALHRGAGRRTSTSTIWTRPSSFPRSWCRSKSSAAWSSTAGPTISSPRPSRSRSARRISCPGSTSRTTRFFKAGSSPTSTRSSRGWVRRTSTTSRSTRRSARSRTTSATGTCRPSGRRAGSRTSRARLQADSPREARGATVSRARRCTRAGDKGRVRAESFADHYSQARLFYRSQTAPEQAHIASALVFELSKVEELHVRERDGRSPAPHRRESSPSASPRGSASRSFRPRLTPPRPCSTWRRRRRCRSSAR